MRNFHFCHHDHFLHEAIVQWQEWLEKEADWYLPNEYSYPLDTKILLGWVFMWDTNLFICLPIQRCLSKYLFPKFWHHQFSNRVHPNPWPSRQITGHSPMNWCIITHLSISPFKYNEQPDALPRVLLIWRIFLRYSSRVSPQGGCNTVSVHFQVVLAYHAELAWVFSSSVNQS